MTSAYFVTILSYLTLLKVLLRSLPYISRKYSLKKEINQMIF